MVDPGRALLVFAVLVGVAALALWPGWGLLSRIVALARMSERVRVEDALKHVYSCERVGRACSIESLAGHLEISTAAAARLLSRLAELGLVLTTPDGPSLTDVGRESALRVVRTHRLWERYLADRTGVPASDWHDEAEHMEHTLSPEEADALSASLGHPSWDPHGDPIPTASGHLPPAERLSLAGAPAGRSVEIVHLEDEPREIYDALLSEGLTLGGRLDLIERTDQNVVVAAGGREWPLDAVMASNVTVRLLPPGERAAGATETLAALAPGETARVLAISPACRGSQRRRLLDLGVVSGTEITAEFTSASGDPIAYDIRGALIALRREQAEWIQIERVA
jgi:DtxR family transcriptional regulator, Mn-dependent transcriptional regulator